MTDELKESPEPRKRFCYTLAEAAALIGCPLRSLRKHVWSGHLPVVVFPGSRKQYVRNEDLQDFIDRCVRRGGKN